MMATYFHGGSEIQATNPSDHLQTLYLMNPNFLSSYADSSHNTNNNNNNNNQSPTNMLLLNPSVGPNGLIPHAPPHQQQPCQQLIGIPLPGPHSDNHSRPSSSTSLHPNREILPAGNNNNSSLHGLAVSRVHYNLWSPTVEPGPAQPGPIHPADVDGQMGFRRAGGAQGLSLSLSPNQQNPVAAVAVSGTAAVGGGGGDDGRMSVTVAAGGSTVSNGVQGVILGSKYLKAAQELLDQVVHVGDFNKGGGGGGPHKEKAKSVAATDDGGSGGGGGGGEGSSTGSKRPFDQLTTVQRQELQMKKAKLLNMLDEVEQRYRQYHTQMQVVVSSFEQAAGFGSAKSYTSLALQTISRQFRCLKDAITSQIKATSKSLGEEDKNGGGSGEGGVGSRLRFVDHQLRQQRALQQLGMMQHNAWRPQRGLPERAVSVLRAWLFEHFLHPYPKDSDKHMLAKQTGLTRSQVSNWFINARVRLWKPMVEEMYAEEMKSQEQLHNGGNIIEDNTNTNANTNTNTTSTNNLDTTTNPPLNDHNKDQLSPTKTTITPHQPDGGAAIIHHSDHHTTTNDMISAMSTTSSQGFSLIGSSSDMESLMGRSPKKQRSGSDIQQNSPSSILSMDMDMKPSDNHHHHHHHQDHGSGFNPYLVHEMGRFNPDPLTTHHHHYPNNGVSLTLGLPHCENNLSLGNHQQNFMSQGMNLGRRIDIGANEAEFCGISMGQPSHPNNNGYDSIDIQSRTRFAAQLLHDFVA